MESAQDILQRLLDERYEAGQADGFAAGDRHGYERAMFEVQDFAKARTAAAGRSKPDERPWGVRVAEVYHRQRDGKPVVVDHPGDENDAETEPSGNGKADPPSLLDTQPPYLRRAYQYLCEHPGKTANEARVKLGGNKNAFYTLARLGLAEKRGTQFFPKEGWGG